MEQSMPSARRMSTRSVTIPGSSTKSTQGSDAASLHTTASGSNETIIDEDQSMFFLEMNPLAPVSVVLLHVLFSCHLEWKHVWPKLPEYHLLIPDLPCHSKSRRMCRKEDFTISLCADLVAQLIREHAHDGRAHIVGLSLGGYIAMDLIIRHPDVVRDAMIVGAWPLKGRRLAVTQHPRLTYAGLWSVLHSPGSLFFKVSGYSGEYQHDEMLKEIKRNVSSRLAKSGFSQSEKWQEDMMVEVGKQDIRICMVAAGKQDDCDGVRIAAKIIKDQSKGGNGSQTQAYAALDAIHAWNLQFPAVFAKGIQCWIERQHMPKEYENMPI
ncbi:Putative 2-succinyl-6-hydroxy-2,4-cyclohexadiene-1-carboxylate synthase [Cytospora mali]|uniref:2-succinyl-6-hydroxy-2,4-cyclohexadiene-1-carboxylate synthase n=1 Tax=Cytospora mali TaxID=578113 RepID=A0A194UVK4_CYTMA|nr:Putative 2-succinyl-6-hydroxy-2,4-cyclohexadiene-1-carboxylate synthase [Valsa mali var. pyri (nom. inval.)]